MREINSPQQQPHPTCPSSPLHIGYWLLQVGMQDQKIYFICNIKQSFEIKVGIDISKTTLF